MIPFDYLLLFVVLFVFFLFVVKERKRLHFESLVKIFNFPIIYIALYRTKFGIELMKKIANKFRAFWKVLGFISIILGYVGLFFILIMLVFMSINAITTKVPSVQLVLPVKAKGVFYVPPIVWLLSIFIIVIIHEGAHGIFSLKNGLNVKNSGLAFIGIIIPLIPAAFVEPDEKKLKNESFRKQAEVFSSGPVANIVFGFLIFLILVFLPIQGFYERYFDTRIRIEEIENTSIIKNLVPEKSFILYVGKEELPYVYSNLSAFKNDLSNVKPGDEIMIYYSEDLKDVKSIRINAGQFNESFRLGVLVSTEILPKERYANSLWILFLVWIVEFLVFLANLNIGIGFANLLPVSIADGGRLWFLLMKKIKNEEFAIKSSSLVSLLVFLIILFNLLIPYIF
ncbi:MAG: site-2 protease family protein [Candidatus Woesearchaeota archaeon]